MNIDVYVYQYGKTNIASDVICIRDPQLGKVTVMKNAQEIISQLLDEGFEVKIHRVKHESSPKRVSRGVGNSAAWR
jgi:hypothetical protein